MAEITVKDLIVTQSKMCTKCGCRDAYDKLLHKLSDVEEE